MGLLNSLIKGSDDAVFVAEVDSGIIRYANDAACRLIGYELHNVIGLHQLQLHPPEDLEYNKQKFSEVTGQDNSMEVYSHVMHKNGDRIPVKITNADIFEENGTRFVAGFFKDLTHFQKLDQIAFIQSHIVRAPIANILGLVYLLEEGLLDEDQIKTAYKDIRRLILDFDEIIREIVNKTGL